MVYRRVEGAKSTGAWLQTRRSVRNLVRLENPKVENHTNIKIEKGCVMRKKMIKYMSAAESGLMTQSVLMMTGDGSTQMSDPSLDKGAAILGKA